MRGLAALPRRLALLAVPLASLSSHATAQEARPSGHARSDINRFGAALQQAVRSGNPGTVAASVYLPVRINDAKGRHRNVDRAQFTATCHAVVNDDVKAATLNEDLDNVFERGQGIMCGVGQVWASGICALKDCPDNRPMMITP